jgi:hypothetical protein
MIAVMGGVIRLTLFKHCHPIHFRMSTSVIITLMRFCSLLKTSCPLTPGIGEQDFVSHAPKHFRHDCADERFSVHNQYGRALVWRWLKLGFERR